MIMIEVVFIFLFILLSIFVYKINKESKQERGKIPFSKILNNKKGSCDG